jgi:hypothetical protein
MYPREEHRFDSTLNTQANNQGQSACFAVPLAMLRHNDMRTTGVCQWWRACP